MSDGRGRDHGSCVSDRSGHYESHALHGAFCMVFLKESETWICDCL